MGEGKEQESTALEQTTKVKSTASEMVFIVTNYFFRLEVSEPDETTTINVRLNPTAKPKDKLNDPPSAVEVEFAETVVLVKPIESVPVEKPLPENTAVVKNSSPKWMSSTPKNNSDDTLPESLHEKALGEALEE